MNNAAQYNYVYLLECGDGSFYCGWTNNLQNRIRMHQQGKGGKYTRSRLPVHLVYFEMYDTKEEAMSREWHLKQLARSEKLRLIQDYRRYYSPYVLSEDGSSDFTE